MNGCESINCFIIIIIYFSLKTINIIQKNKDYFCFIKKKNTDMIKNSIGVLQLLWRTSLVATLYHYSVSILRYKLGRRLDNGQMTVYLILFCFFDKMNSNTHMEKKESNEICWSNYNYIPSCLTNLSVLWDLLFEYLLYFYKFCNFWKNEKQLSTQ